MTSPLPRADEPAGAAVSPGGGRLALRHWSVTVKLVAVLLVPTLFLVAFAVLRVVEQAGQANPSGAAVTAVVLLVALLLAAGVLWVVARSLLRPLRLLRRSALDVAERRLPGAVRTLREGETPDAAVEPTPVGTREEIGEVARSVDQVHEQAVRLAAEQAELRSTLTGIFVNLARRSQTLVERQLRLIEQLENHEEDPEALAHLFQLDHLATRMRRNSENLLVLAGSDLARRNGRPIALVDVLRAAASEVEQYQRVDLAPPLPVRLLGHTAGDVVHLVAELLENATTFSPPETRVEVGATTRPDGTVVLEIADRGVGLSEDDLADANARLGNPPVAEVSASRRMGLFVVGRLAVRHGITVSLRPREGGGTVATTVLPAATVLPEGPEAAAGASGAAVPLEEPDAPTRDLPRPVDEDPGDEFSGDELPGDELPGDEEDDEDDRRATVLGEAGPDAESDGVTVWRRPDPPAAAADTAATTPAYGLPVARDEEEESAPDPEDLAPAGEAADHERTPIFEEVASMWFREPSLSGRDDSAGWSSLDDEGWRAAASSAAAPPADAGVTAAGLPRRRPRAHLVPGSARGAGVDVDVPAPAPQRDANAVRGRLARYQRGVTDARSSRPTPTSDSGGAPVDSVSRDGTEEDQ